MKDRIILHCDLNNFFASVSLLFNSTLKDFPVAVCGSKEERHGIVLAKNELAKSFGVKTAEPIFEAMAKCPDLITLPPMMDKYKEYSGACREIFKRYTDLIEPFGIDESWLDVTGSTLLFGDGETIANRIRTDIKRELGITASVGVSFNKIFAKLGSDMKKPDAVTVISRENFKEKVWPLPVSDLLFVGKSSAKRLRDSGIFTIGDIAACSDTMLHRLLGKNGDDLRRYALGEDCSPVCRMDADYKPKSIGRSITRGKDFCSEEEIWQLFLELSTEISDNLRKYSLMAGSVQIHLRDTLLATREISRPLKFPTNSAMLIAKKGMEIFRENNISLPLHSAGIRAINLKAEDSYIQQDLFGEIEKDEKQEKIETSVYEVRKKFGMDSIKSGTVIKSEE